MTDDAEKELLVADFTVFTPTGPSVLFIRSRRPMSHAETESAVDFMSKMRWPSGVVCMWLDNEMDVFAVGEAEMKKLGWAKIPESTPP
jgi:hypothetical protein